MSRKDGMQHFFDNLTPKQWESVERMANEMNTKELREQKIREFNESVATERREKSLKWMKDPNLWSKMVLPLMNSGREGILLGDKPTVYLCNMFMPPPDMSTCPQEVYTSYEEIIAAGWRVD